MLKLLCTQEWSRYLSFCIQIMLTHIVPRKWQSTYYVSNNTSKSRRWYAVVIYQYIIYTGIAPARPVRFWSDHVFAQSSCTYCALADKTHVVALRYELCGHSLWFKLPHVSWGSLPAYFIYNNIKGIVTLYKQPWYYFLHDRVHMRCARLWSREHRNHEQDGTFFQCPSQSRRLSAVPKLGPVERKVRTTNQSTFRVQESLLLPLYVHYSCCSEVTNLVEGERGLDESITYLPRNQSHQCTTRSASSPRPILVALPQYLSLDHRHHRSIRLHLR